jgi:putative transposase
MIWLTTNEGGETMTEKPEHHRRSIRLSGYDYSQPGAYFVTLCAKNRECLFGEIVNGEMRLNDAGRMAQQCWNEIPNHFPHALLDQFVIMPNHIHGIIFIVDSPDHRAPSVRARHAVPQPVPQPKRAKDILPLPMRNIRNNRGNGSPPTPPG